MNRNLLISLPAAYRNVWAHRDCAVTLPNRETVNWTDPADLPHDESDAVVIAPAGHTILEDSHWVRYARDSEIAVYIPATYNPLQHAKSLIIEGDTDSAHELLDFIPDEFANDRDAAGAIAFLKLLCVYNWLAPESGPAAVYRLGEAQQRFYAAVQADPDISEAYPVMANIWEEMGDADMAERLRATGAGLSFRPSNNAVPIQIDQDDRQPIPEGLHLLFITHPEPDHGLDTIYDGLCREIGEGNIDIYPDKPSLRGDAPKAMRYPCAFSWNASPLPLEEILDRLKQRYYNAVIIGVSPWMIDVEAMKAILAAAGETSLVVLDQRDDPVDSTYDLAQRWGLCEHIAYFKREMIRSGDYDSRVRPLPLAYSEAFAFDGDTGRDIPLFWAGVDTLALRRLYLDTIRAHVEVDIDAEYDPEAYRNMIRRARMGLSLFGGGYDTVRYWEVPANGAMLIAERPPIRIPNDFIDGESTVFFDTPRDAADRIAYYIDHPEEAAAIAHRGHEHYRRHHTSTARARQLLNAVMPMIRESKARTCP